MKADTEEDTKIPNSANLNEGETFEILIKVSEMHISMIIELHMATSTKSSYWWYDSSATVHVCNYKSQFKKYEDAADGQEMLMENHNAAEVMGKWIVEVQFTSENKLILVEIRYNNKGFQDYAINFNVLWMTFKFVMNKVIILCMWMMWVMGYHKKY
jgi:hypothetical protein